jgi:hypothetical protein
VPKKRKPPTEKPEPEILIPASKKLKGKGWMVAQFEVRNISPETQRLIQQFFRDTGREGGKTRAAKYTHEELSNIQKQAAKKIPKSKLSERGRAGAAARWQKRKPKEQKQNRWKPGGSS